jgi:hypothetical protein
MTVSTSAKTPPKRRAKAKPQAADAANDNRCEQDPAPRRQISPDLASLLAERETQLMMEADNVGMEQLIAALTRIPIPRKKR